MELETLNQNQINNPTPQKSYLKKALFIGVGFILFIVFFVYFFLFRIPHDFPVGEIVNFKEGSSLRTFSRVLYQEKIITSRPVFEFFVILRGGEKKLIPGDYLFDQKIPVFQVADKIINGDKGLAPVKITIPEGFTNLEIANLIELKLKDFDKFRFLEKANQGYLFPETYFFTTTDTDKEVLEKMDGIFQQKIKTLESDIKNTNKSLNEIIVMASIIEREAKGDQDREAISSILWKRISIGMPLQADAAPETYKIKGLPNEPIANPGLASILAAIFPKTTQYLYYLHDKDGKIYFAKTFDEHRQNIKKYLR